MYATTPPVFSPRIVHDHGSEFVVRDETETINTLQRVVLMTPENIPLDSFMYESLVDMSDEHLRKLYKKVIALNSARSHHDNFDRR